jgi:hypothetical protein
LLVDPLEEAHDVRHQPQRTRLLDLRRRLLGPRGIKLEDPPQTHQAFSAHDLLADRGLPEPAPERFSWLDHQYSRVAE